MGSVSLLKREYLAAPPTTTLRLAAYYPINYGTSVQMLDCVGLHDIEMFVGAEEPYIPGWHRCPVSSWAKRIRQWRRRLSSERVGVELAASSASRCRDKASCPTHLWKL